MVKMNDPVLHPETEKATTIGELDKEGLIEFKKVDNFEGHNNTAYFADIKGTNSGWRIRKTAYLSRTDQKEKLQKEFN